ncbi:hypothetical protein CERSUDRAFT_115929 [Gelatoporia subvermispora B]|uniref:MACPF domain-containing protein n=1 Tax=Ceriporiopsis subvermispora (strain B) TaxID=914234 RepID=M2QG19_CERS8|nr:hypothetical protein CERSUDRAFT_115929 [Gelatoporia subvermispora B]
MSQGELPATDKLGYALDLTTMSGQDIKGLLTSLKTSSRVLKLAKNDKPIQLYNELYHVPSNIAVESSNAGIASVFRPCTSGSSLRAQLKADPSILAPYSAFNAGNSCAYSVYKSFRDDCDYVLYDVTHIRYTAHLDSNGDSLQNDCAASIARLPQIFVPERVQTFKDFFASYGSHTVTDVTYGARLNLLVWRSRLNITDDAPDLSLRASVALESISSGEDLMAYLPPQNNANNAGIQHRYALIYSTFCEGGGTEEANRIQSNTHAFKDYDAWMRSTSTDPCLINIGVKDIWTIAGKFPDPTVSTRAQALQDAFEYLISHTPLCKTPAQFDINSDWGEFVLTSPGAMLIMRSVTGDQPQSVLSEPNRIIWGLGGGKLGRARIKFEIYYDGSTINFWTECGAPGTGQDYEGAIVIIGEEKYYNIGSATTNRNVTQFSQISTYETPCSVRDDITSRMMHLRKHQ